MARSLAERGCRTYDDFDELIINSNDFDLQALQQGLLSRLRGDAVTTLELPVVASPATGRVHHAMYPDIEDHLRDGHFYHCNREQQQEQENGGVKRQQLENGGEQQQEQEDGDLPAPTKERTWSRLYSYSSKRRRGNPSLIGMMTLTPQRRRRMCREPGTHQGDDGEDATDST
ncbi:unnamed protein product [Orchesella dallaii]|uniref:Uncharacterized protein n=1 Tax=Orchesella dallaii TaxID=48710 RepID=A0ABP1RNS6_9HEXA